MGTELKTKAKTIILKGEMLDAITLRTMKMLSDLVGVTLGPGGNPVLIERPGFSPLITKDGVTVAESVSLSNSTEHVISEAAKEACQRTNREAGDGPQPLYSKILTPKGFITMGDVRVGMDICGTNGTIQKVLGVFPKGEKEIYRIEFANGRIVECCGDHLWMVANVNTTPYGNIEIKTVSDLLKDYVSYNSEGGVRRKYYTPRSLVEFYTNSAEMPLDPYLVGVLLGDGSLSGTGSVELSLGMKKEHIIDKLILPEGFHTNSTYVEEKHSYRVKISGRDRHGNYIKDIITSLGLLGRRSDNKFIPKSYLYTSIANRKQLLHGLLDTDGYINTRGLFEFSSVSEELAKDMVDLCRSLGQTVTLSKIIRKEGMSYSMTPIYRVTQLKEDKCGDRIDKITATGTKTPMQCIKVSNPDNLYITNDYITTHNTTTAIVLAQAIVEEGMKFLKNNPTKSPQELCRELDATSNEMVELLKAGAKPIGTPEELLHVAMISSNSDEDVAKSVVEAIDLVGQDGTIITEDGSGRKTVVEMREGFPIQKGLNSLGAVQELFINRPEDQQCVFDLPYILLYDGDLNVAQDLGIPLQNLFVQMGDNIKPMVIVAHKFSPQVIQVISFNVKANRAAICLLETVATAQPNSKHHLLHDLAAFTGGTVFDPISKNLKSAKVEDLGVCEQSRIGRYQSVILGMNDSDAVKERMEVLKKQMEIAESDFDAEIIKERVSQLSGGIATIYVGGTSELEIREKKHRIEDTINSVRSAIEMGVVPGGGSALLALSLVLREKQTPAKSILASSFTVPFNRILSNSGVTQQDIINPGTVVQGSVTPNSNLMPTLLYDSLRHQLVEPFKAGIIDPVKVTISALNNAVSVSQLLMTLGGAVTIPRDIVEERQAELAAQAFAAQMSGT